MTGDAEPAEPAEPVDPEEEANFRADLALVVSVALTIVLYQLPWAQTLAWPLVLLSTLAHELGHGLTALLVGGRFKSLVISTDASGLAHCWAEGSLRSALVSAGGLVGPAIAAAFLFLLARKDKLARASLVAMGLALALTVPVLVENTFGKVFVALVAATFLAIGVRAPAWLAKHAVAFVAVQLSLSVWSRGDYLFTPVARMATGDVPSDVATMSHHLGLPYWFWGIVCAAFSVVALLVGGWLFLRGATVPFKRRSRGRASPPPPIDIH